MHLYSQHSTTKICQTCIEWVKLSIFFVDLIIYFLIFSLIAGHAHAPDADQGPAPDAQDLEGEQGHTHAGGHVPGPDLGITKRSY